MICSIRTLLFLLFIVHAPVAFAQNERKPARQIPKPVEALNDRSEFEGLFEPEQTGSRDHFFSEFLNMIVMLCIVLGVMVLLAWLAKYFLAARVQQVNAQSAIRIEEKRALGPKSILYLIEVEGNRILIGETPAGLCRLAQLAQDSAKQAQGLSSRFSRMMEEKSQDTDNG